MLEVAVFNIESAIAAEAAGANRLELCENPNEGGTTPSYGTLTVVAKIISIPIFPTINFFYICFDNLPTLSTFSTSFSSFTRVSRIRAREF